MRPSKSIFDIPKKTPGIPKEFEDPIQRHPEKPKINVDFARRVSKIPKEFEDPVPVPAKSHESSSSESSSSDSEPNSEKIESESHCNHDCLEEKGTRGSKQVMNKQRRKIQINFQTEVPQALMCSDIVFAMLTFDLNSMSEIVYNFTRET